MNRRQFRLTVFSAVMWLAFAAMPAFAQSAPNLSGTWRLNFDKSGDRIAGNGADVPFPSQMVVTQSATELSVRRTSVRQDAFAAVYKLDGSRVTVAAPAGYHGDSGGQVRRGDACHRVASIVLVACRRYDRRLPGDVVRHRQRTHGQENRHAGR